MYYHAKPIIDTTLALIMGILLLAPIFFVAIIIKFESSGPILFKQKRYGKNKVPFTIYKFRTMYQNAPHDVATAEIKNVSVITPSGRLLRRTGFDEIPQLINIIKGQMSFIGPRPVILREKDLITLRDSYGANSYMPGISGWAQSNGRDEVEIEEKAYMDGIYAKNFGLRMDLKCFFKTLGVVFTGSGHREGFDDGIKVKKIHSLKYALSRTSKKQRMKVVARDSETVL